MLKTNITGTNQKNVAEVIDEGSLKVTLSPTLGVEKKITSVPFSRFLTVNNDGVTSDLTVSGTPANPTEAFVSGQSLGDFYVTAANILIADDGAVALNRFGSSPALINGVDFFYNFPSADVILGTARTNFDVIRFSTLTKPTGGKSDAFQLANANAGNEDAYNPILDLARNSPNGLGARLRQNSNDKLGIRIKDDLSGVSTFNILLIGFIRIIDEQGQ